MTKFKHVKHRQLWEKVKVSWNWVQKFGLNDTKTIIRRLYLGDEREIPNSCYACEYAVEMQSESASRCFKCPLKMEWCNSLASPFYQLTQAIQNHNKEEFQQICDIMINLPVKEGVECE